MLIISKLRRYSHPTISNATSITTTSNISRSLRMEQLHAQTFSVSDFTNQMQNQ